MKFSDYRIADGIKTSIEKLGYKKPTDIQYKSIPPILKGEDVLAIAQTGTGKTAAFAIPILHKVQEKKIKKRNFGVSCLVMAPTHELAIQIESVFNKLGKHTSVKTLAIYGGVDQQPQIKTLDKGVDILIATPGRMFDLVSQRHLRLDKVETLILDEADHMLDLGFIKDIRDLMKHIPKNRQTLFFSATIDKEIKKLAYSLVRDAIRIQISPKDPVSKNVDHSVAKIEMDDKRFFLEKLIRDNKDDKIMVFVRTKVRAERVKNAMERVLIQTDTIHSGREQADRERVMAKFKSGELKVLIATDVSARGIDVKNVEYVVNYDMPDSPENYVHRIGRTGRGTARGKAVSFCSKEENEMLREIEDLIGKEIPKLIINKEDYQYIMDSSEDKTKSIKMLINEINQLEKEQKPKKKKSLPKK